MTIDAIVSILQQHSTHPSEIAIMPNTIPPGLAIPPNQLVAIGYVLQTHPELYFDYLACITAIDNGPAAGTVDAIYQLYAIPYNQSLMLKVTVPRDHPHCNIPSVSGIWQAANWHEREAYDLVGIHFEGHPDLRRILLPADWAGHPLRTDYTPDTTIYHGIAID